MRFIIWIGVALVSAFAASAAVHAGAPDVLSWSLAGNVEGASTAWLIFGWRPGGAALESTTFHRGEQS